jgi:hypothetical protein
VARHYDREETRLFAVDEDVSEMWEDSRPTYRFLETERAVHRLNVILCVTRNEKCIKQEGEAMTGD